MEDVHSSPSKETTGKDLIGDHTSMGDDITSSSSGSSDGSSSTGSEMDLDKDDDTPVTGMDLDDNTSQKVIELL
jgi:hypothetical protein